MVQTGDPSGTGKGGTSIWGKKFEDEFHETLKVCCKCSIQHKCTLESKMCKKCSIQHKMYARE